MIVYLYGVQGEDGKPRKPFRDITTTTTMALNLNLLIQPCSLSGFSSPRIFPLKPFLRSSSCLAPRRVHCLVSTHQNCDPSVARRSANYQPSIWDFDFIQSVKSDWTGEMSERRAKKLENVRCMINAGDVGLLDRLELIDDVGRLGLGYIFKEEIKRALDEIAIDENNNVGTNKGLHAVALRFRLFRQHGYAISQDVFNGFKDDMGNFKASLCEDIRGMLSLFEASHLALEGENILDEAKYFTTTHLNNLKGPIAPNLEKKVNHSLELPLHQRMLRLEARWYIEMCKSEEYIHPDLLELAMLDFNMVQAIHQKDMRDSSRWWRDLGLGSHSELSFARDRLMENFLWTIGVIFDPQHDYCRKGLTKVNALITTIDDVYDVYGTLDELQLFTDAVERWDINAMEQLPNYMKICFLSLYNTVNQMAYDTLKEQGWDIIPYLKKGWVDLCKSFLVEAKWYHNNYTPTLEEYLNNAWISMSGPVMLVHTYFFVKQEINMDSLECLERYPDIIRWSSMVFRLCNDLGTSTDELERGDVPKSIQCYMHETGVSEEVACEHIKHLISDTWKKMNKDRVDDSIFPQPFIGTAVNLARMAQCTYQYGDGHGVPDKETKDRVFSLLVKPISPKEIKPTNLVAI